MSLFRNIKSYPKEQKDKLLLDLLNNLTHRQWLDFTNDLEDLVSDAWIDLIRNFFGDESDLYHDFLESLPEDIDLKIVYFALLKLEEQNVNFDQFIDVFQTENINKLAGLSTTRHKECVAGNPDDEVVIKRVRGRTPEVTRIYRGKEYEIYDPKPGTLVVSEPINGGGAMQNNVVTHVYRTKDGLPTSATVNLVKCVSNDEVVYYKFKYTNIKPRYKEGGEWRDYFSGSARDTKRYIFDRYD